MTSNKKIRAAQLVACFIIGLAFTYAYYEHESMCDKGDFWQECQQPSIKGVPSSIWGN